MRSRRQNQTIRILPVIIIILGAVLMITGAVLLIRSQGSGPSQQATATVILPGGGEPTYPDIERVSLADAKKAFDEGTAVFLDVRGATIFADSHIPGAVNIPLADLPTRVSELDPQDWIITYCT